ncbi:MAG: hypothetical protein Tsb0034_28320 [Ekhidna sp.]
MKTLYNTACLLLIAILISCSSGEQREQNADQSRQTSVQKTFEYQPENPVNGELLGVIEIGSIGLNYFIVSMDKQDRWKLVDSEYGRSNLIYDNNNTSTEIITKVEAFQKEILEKGVSPDKLHVIASSKAVDFSNIEDLKSELSDLGLSLKYVNPTEEGAYALRAAIPEVFMRESFLVDIGSGNTKISWFDGQDTISIETYGSKYYLDGTPDTTAFRDTRNALLQIPEKNRNLCLMIGGMAYEFAVYTNKRLGRYTILQAPSAYPSNEDKWNAGTVIYRALYMEPTYSHIFDWDANFSIGYLMSAN